jgi:hypothetical protein
MDSQNCRDFRKLLFVPIYQLVHYNNILYMLKNIITTYIVGHMVRQIITALSNNTHLILTQKNPMNYTSVELDRAKND